MVADPTAEDVPDVGAQDRPDRDRQIGQRPSSGHQKAPRPKTQEPSSLAGGSDGRSGLVSADAIAGRSLGFGATARQPAEHAPSELGYRLSMSIEKATADQPSELAATQTSDEPATAIQIGCWTLSRNPDRPRPGQLNAG
jgi:hypothetical protein